MIRNVKSLALPDVYDRVLQPLNHLAEEVDGVPVIVQLSTQQEMASRIGCSRGMVSKILKDLNTGGYLTSSRQKIDIRRRFPSSW